MAKTPEDMVVRLLQQIQATQAEHTRRFDEHDRRFEKLDKGFEEYRESVVTALGFSAHANVRHNTVDERLDELISRVENIESLAARVERLETESK